MYCQGMTENLRTFGSMILNCRVIHGYGVRTHRCAAIQLNSEADVGMLAVLGDVPDELRDTIIIAE
jgi:hypothetical protein